MNDRAHLPSVFFHEGADGIRNALELKLEASETIYAYAGLEYIDSALAPLILEYRKKREKLKIRVRVLGIRTPNGERAMKEFDQEISEFRFLPSDSSAFNMQMSVYD